VDDPDRTGKKKGKKQTTPTITPTPSPNKTSQNNSPDILGDDGDQPSPSSPPSSPKFPQDFNSISDKDIPENCWKLIVNTLDHIKSNKLRFILTHWVVFGSTVLVKDMQLTGMHQSTLIHTNMGSKGCLGVTPLGFHVLGVPNPVLRPVSRGKSEFRIFAL